MNTEVDQLKKSFSKAVLWILLLLAAATGTTYAWFTLTGINSTNVTPMAGIWNIFTDRLLRTRMELQYFTAMQTAE